MFIQPYATNVSPLFAVFMVPPLMIHTDYRTKLWVIRGGVVVKALRYKPAGHGFDFPMV